jgi:hypothetical protein
MTVLVAPDLLWRVAACGWLPWEELGQGYGVVLNAQCKARPCTSQSIGSRTGA